MTEQQRRLVQYLEDGERSQLATLQYEQTNLRIRLANPRYQNRRREDNQDELGENLMQQTNLLRTAQMRVSKG